MRSSTDECDRPRHGAIALRDDDFTVDEVEFSFLYDSSTMSLTSRASQISAFIQKPSYNLYYDRAGNETRFLRQLKLATHDAIEDWRDTKLPVAIAKDRMEFGDDEFERWEARTEWETLYIGGEIMRVKKKRMEELLRVHKAMARNLKAKRKEKLAKKKSRAHIRELQAEREGRHAGARQMVFGSRRRLN